MSLDRSRQPTGTIVKRALNGRADRAGGLSTGIGCRGKPKRAARRRSALIRSPFAISMYYVRIELRFV